MPLDLLWGHGQKKTPPHACCLVAPLLVCLVRFCSHLLPCYWGLVVSLTRASIVKHSERPYSVAKTRDNEVGCEPLAKRCIFVLRVRSRWAGDSMEWLAIYCVVMLIKRGAPSPVWPPLPLPMSAMHYSVCCCVGCVSAVAAVEPLLLLLRCKAPGAAVPLLPPLLLLCASWLVWAVGGECLVGATGSSSSWGSTSGSVQ